MNESERRRMDGKRWRFGNQTAAQERREIESAKRAGLVWHYMQGQRWAHLIEAETERRRALKLSGRREAHRQWQP